jgi:uncharacterized Ntn-hydrolase superfamily protein
MRNGKFAFIRCLLTFASVMLAFAFAAAQEREDDSDFGSKEILFSTFSICAIDPATGECGVAVTTRVPFVGRAVPWVEAGVGGVATQSWTVVEYGRRGLELMKQGVAPQEAIERMLAEDEGREQRQLGLINMKGESAAFTGKECGEWAGGRQGKNYTVQANIMVGPEVVQAVADSFESTEGTGMPLAERMILALEAGQKQGGDKRWGLFQSAAIKIADPRNPGRAGDFISLAIEVGEHPTPVAEMKRIYYTTANRLGYREFSEIRGRDVEELHRMLHALGYWRKDLEVFPERPVYNIDPGLREKNREEFIKLRLEYQKKRDAYDTEFCLFDAGTVAAVETFRKEQGMDYQGNPAGLVDQRFIAGLRDAYYALIKSKNQ